jgi:hypothetical protein
MKKEINGIPGFWRAPSEKKTGPFSRYLLKKFENVVYILPIFSNDVPKFFDSKGNFKPEMVDDYINFSIKKV